jgi:uncharacterized glyoxalase superfamily protein PhnB
MARAEHSADDVDARAGGACVVPTVRYRDVPAAIDWLCDAFGFREHRVVAGTNGGLRYAELTFGSGMVMVAPVEESAMGKFMVQPGEIGGVETQICYLFVEDAKAHYARAKAAGADIVLDIEDQANCGRGYSCRDPEGHIWNFGTYDPWERQGWLGPRSPRPRRGGARKLLAMLLLVGVATAAMVHRPARDAVGGLGAAVLARVAHTVDAARADKGAAPTPDELRQQLAQAHAAKAAADRAAREARELLALEQRAREAAELAAKELAERPAPKLNAAAGDAAAKVALETRAQLDEARSAKTAAERAAKEARELLGQVRGAKQAADRAASLARDQARREYMARRAAAARAAAVAQAASPHLTIP